jgi:hypothetical protein
MKNLTVSSGRRPFLLSGLALAAVVAALAAWAQDSSTQSSSSGLPFGHLNSVGLDSKPAPTPASPPAGANITVPAGNVTTQLKQVELAATSLQIVSLGGGVAFWDPVKRLIYVYPGDFSVCTGIYQMGTPGQPMQRVGP